jgi:hypothetical protein
MLNGYFMHEIGIDFELQAAVHDKLLEQVFGVAISAKAAKLLRGDSRTPASVSTTALVGSPLQRTSLSNSRRNSMM